MTDLTEIQQFVWEKCGSPTHPNFPSVTSRPIEIGLAHVLNVLGESNTVDREWNLYQGDFSVYAFRVTDRESIVFHWKLLKENGEQALFKDQSPETQIAIAKLLGWEK